MPSSQNETFANFTAGPANTPVSAEGTIAATPAISAPAPNGRYLVEFAGVFTAGAGTTAVVIRIRRDSGTGTIVYGGATLTIAAGQTLPIVASVVDSLAGDVAGQLWVLTAQQTGGTGAGNLTGIATKVTTGV